MRVLVTDGGRGASRSALAVVRALHRSGHTIGVTTRDGNELAARSRGVSLRSDVPPASAGADYAGAIARIVERDRFDLVIPTSDDALIALGRPEARLVDKRRLAEAASAHRIPMPRSFTAATIDEIDRHRLDWPLVVKPVVGAGAVTRIDRRDQLEALTAKGPVLIQPFVDAEMTAIAGLHWQGSLRAAVHQRYLRRWPVDCGPASAAVTIPPDHERERDLLRLLEGFDGIFQAQYVGGELIDLNPRPYGSMSLATAAGVNLPLLLCALHEEPESTTASRSVLRARPGKRYRWIEGDLRHLVHELIRGRQPVGPLVADMLPRSGTVHSVLCVHDPRPGLSRAGQILTALVHGDW